MAGLRLRIVLAAACAVALVASLSQTSGAETAVSKTGPSSSAFRSAFAGSPANGTSDGRVHVEMLHHLDAATARATFEGHGGVATGSVPGAVVEGDIPLANIEALEASPGVDFVRPPMSINLPPKEQKTISSSATVESAATAYLGEEVTKMRANVWHRAGFRGSGQKIGIIDLFSAGIYNAARRAGQVPAPAGTICFHKGARCNVFSIAGSGASHGTMVTEVVHEMAPAAQKYLAFATTASDLERVVRYFDARGVRIITRSLSTPYDGAGNGTGPTDTVVNHAIARGMTFFNSAGNGADGDYYRATFRDDNLNQYHEFAPGDELMRIPCNAFSMGLRWNDFREGGGTTDFDLEVWSSDGTVQIAPPSDDSQGASGGNAPPLENFPGNNIPCGSTNFVNIAIKLFCFGPGATNCAIGTNPFDTLEFQLNNQVLEYGGDKAFSAAVGICDSRSPGQVCVGSIDPPFGTRIAAYSSRGPTNDGRKKPDISAASCVRNFTATKTRYSCAPGKFGFDGTSAATPAAAGAALLIRDRSPSLSAVQLANAVRSWTVDRGTRGWDNTYGKGEFILRGP